MRLFFYYLVVLLNFLFLLQSLELRPVEADNTVNISQSVGVSGTENTTYVPTAFTMNFAMNQSGNSSGVSISSASGITSITDPVGGAGGTDPSGGYGYIADQSNITNGYFSLVIKFPRCKTVQTGGALNTPELIASMSQSEANTSALSWYIRKSEGGTDITLGTTPSSTSIFGSSDDKRVDSDDATAATIGNVTTDKGLYMKGVIFIGATGSPTLPARSLQINLGLQEDS